MYIPTPSMTANKVTKIFNIFILLLALISFGQKTTIENPDNNDDNTTSKFGAESLGIDVSTSAVFNQSVEALASLKNHQPDIICCEA